MVPDPWDVLARTDLVLCSAPMPEMGRYYHRQRVIILRTGLLLVEQRATLWHELVHARRGDRLCHDGWFDEQQERSVDREAARWSMPLPALLAAFIGSRCYADVADGLKTTERLLRVRLNALHPAERAAVQSARLAMEDAA